MKIVSDSRTQISQPQSAITESIEEVKRVIQDCKAKETSTYITINGKPYLVTSHGAMSYEGTATVAYSQSRQYREMPEKNEEKS